MSVKLGTTSSVVAPDSRSQVVSALAGVDSLTATPNVPDVPTEGAAWPVWVQTTFDGVMGLPGMATFDVYALLPAGSAQTTAEAADALLGQLCQALWLIAVVQLAEPVAVRFDSQTTMPGIRLRIRMRGISR
jgi:hypothetical protein